MNDTNTKKRTIYIAGPMRGHPKFNYPAFDAAEEWLKLLGWNVVNPVKMGDAYGTPDSINSNPRILARLMSDEREAVKECDAIYLLRGWEKSVGARGELAVALHTGAEILVQEVTE